MSVKGIFQALIGTIVVIVLASLFIEILNVNTTGLQINQLSRLGIKQACDFFGQETYKRDDAPISNLPGLKGEDGSIAIPGFIYGDKSPDEIYDALYKNNPGFTSWASNYSGVWENLDYMLMGMSLPNNLDWSEDNKFVADMYYGNKMTPLNLGVPYLDKEIVERVARWNVGALFSNGQNLMIMTDENGRTYVKYKGFRVYAGELEIEEIEYRLYNALEEREEFMEKTNVDPFRLGIDNTNDERAQIMIAGLRYTVPVAYEGITPMRSIMKYVLNSRVEGMAGNSGGAPGGTMDLVDADLRAGGFDGNYDLPVPGTLLYFLVK